MAGVAARREDAPSRLMEMTRALAHRGPDASSQWLGPGIGLAHTRLAIIDLAGGGQPMWSADGQTVIVFNGEIYNHEDLRCRLESRGYRFRTRSDTEVIWAALDAFGIDEGLLSLRGMFAFALYNVDTQRLLLARDRIGVKPLYWAAIGDSVVFGSEQKALLASGLVPRRVNAVAVHDFLGQGYPTTPATCWKDVHMLEPGTWLERAPDGIRTGRYWTWEPQENAQLDAETATQMARDTLLDSAKAHLLSDVPVGAFLSGGLDSSLLVTLLSDVRPGISTFNVGFDDPAFDESAAARAVAVHCGTDHHQLHLGSDQADPELFRRILDQYDEPFGDSSCIPVFLVCQEMRKHVKVVLSGDGADEVFGGYPRYRYAQRIAQLSRLNSALPAIAGPIAVLERRFSPHGRRAAKAWRFAQMPIAERLCALQTYFNEEDRTNMYRPEFARSALAMGPTWTRFEPLITDNGSDPAQQLIGAEIRLRLHADYLRKIDVASSAHGLEVRVPYLDGSMLDFAAQLPVRLKITRYGQTKFLSRRLGRQLLPPEVARRPKQGFSIPLDRWGGSVMRDFLHSLLLGRQSCISELFTRPAIEQVWHNFAYQPVEAGLSRYQRYQRLFLLASLELWLKRWRPAFV